MITGPQSMPVFSDGTITPRTSRRSSRYLKTIEESRTPAAPALGRLGPVTEGLSAGCRHGRPHRRRGLDRGEGAMSDHAGRHETLAASSIHDGDLARGSTRRGHATPAGLETPHSARARDPVPRPRAARARLPARRHRPEGRQAPAEREVAALFGLSTLGTLLFIVAFFAVAERTRRHRAGRRVGLRRRCSASALGLALFCIGAGAIHWAKTLMPDDEIVEERKPMRSTDEDRAGRCRGVRGGRRGCRLRPAHADPQRLLGALAPLGLPAVVLLRDLGPLPGRRARHTVWDEAGKRLMLRSPTGHDRSSREDLEIGGVVNVGAGGHRGAAEHRPQRGGRRRTAILIRSHLEEMAQERAGRKGTGTSSGIVAYSKICTHVGCPVGLYEQQTHHLLCPCHQSTFDVAAQLQGHLRPGAPRAAAAHARRRRRGIPGRRRATSRSRSDPASGSAGT